MAEYQKDDEGYLFIENHCPICAAATICQSFCRSELKTFQTLFGEEVDVTRIDHIVAGARRCAYRIAPAGSGPFTQ
jgi:predicted ArsR family transcriptional regulator